ncbi:MAG: hypothetical protein ACFFC1_16995, partial [Promethearchaeota archaeon]
RAIFGEGRRINSIFEGVPVMTVVGSSEFSSEDKTIVAQLVPNACHFQIQGKDHLIVPSDPKFHMVVKAFLDYVNRK